jgi:hypothetical protein
MCIHYYTFPLLFLAAEFLERKNICYTFFLILCAVRLSPLGTAATVWPIVPAPDDDGDCGAIDGMRTGRGNRSTERKPAPVALGPPQIPHDLTQAQTQAATVGSWQLTA